MSDEQFRVALATWTSEELRALSSTYGDYFDQSEEERAKCAAIHERIKELEIKRWHSPTQHKTQYVDDTQKMQEWLEKNDSLEDRIFRLSNVLYDSSENKGDLLQYFPRTLETHRFYWTEIDKIALRNRITIFLKQAIEQTGSFNDFLKRNSGIPANNDRYVSEQFDRYFTLIASNFHNLVWFKYSNHGTHLVDDARIVAFKEKFQKINGQILLNCGYTLDNAISLCLGLGLGKIFQNAARVGLSKGFYGLGFIRAKLIEKAPSIQRAATGVARKANEYLIKNPRLAETLAKAQSGANRLLRGGDELPTHGVIPDEPLKLDLIEFNVALFVDLPNALDVALDQFLKIENFSWEKIKKNNGWTDDEYQFWKNTFGEKADKVISLTGPIHTIVNMVGSMWERHQLESELVDTFQQYAKMTDRALDRSFALKKDAEWLQHQKSTFIYGLILDANEDWRNKIFPVS